MYYNTYNYNGYENEYVKRQQELADFFKATQKNKRNR